MKEPKKELPLAMFSALILLTIAYILVSTAVILLMTPAQMQNYSGHVLANAAQAITGKTGFVIIGSSALLACAAALNATIFAASNQKVQLLWSALSSDHSQLRRLPVNT